GDIKLSFSSSTRSLGITSRPPSPMDTSTLPLITVETQRDVGSQQHIVPVSGGVNALLNVLVKTEATVCWARYCGVNVRGIFTRDMWPGVKPGHVLMGMLTAPLPLCHTLQVKQPPGLPAALLHCWVLRRLKPPHREK
ncbi:hypothetical protein KUCAC02_026450, partial [Chaenocephalus aceratus]